MGPLYREGCDGLPVCQFFSFRRRRAESGELSLISTGRTCAHLCLVYIEGRLALVRGFPPPRADAVFVCYVLLFDTCLYTHTNTHTLTHTDVLSYTYI